MRSLFSAVPSTVNFVQQFICLLDNITHIDCFNIDSGVANCRLVRIALQFSKRVHGPSGL